MTQIDELQSRIAHALDRISKGVEGLAAPQPEPEPVAEQEPETPTVQADPEEITRLTEALEDERMANAQLEERVKQLHAKLDEVEASGGGQGDAALVEQFEAQKEGMATLDMEMQRLRASNEMLRRTNAEMREALELSVGEPHLINKAMLAELEALRAARATETAEARAVLGALEPLLGGDSATGEAVQ